MAIRWPDLNNGQACGLACVVCFRDVGDAAPVGVSAATGEPVRACAGRCAPLVGHREPEGEQMAIGGQPGITANSKDGYVVAGNVGVLSNWSGLGHAVNQRDGIRRTGSGSQQMLKRYVMVADLGCLLQPSTSWSSGSGNW